MAEREVRYCTTADGVRIAYSLDGEGPPLLFIAEFVESFGLDHLMPARLQFMRALGAGRRLLLYDARGIGLSQRDVYEMSLESMCLDIDAVARATGVQRFSLWGGAGAGPRALYYAASRPQNVARLVLYAAYSEPAAAIPREGLLSYAQLCRTNWEVGAQVWGDLSHRRRFPEAGSQLADIFRSSCSGQWLAWVLEYATDNWKTASLLPRISAPTLLLHRRNDDLMPFSASQQLATGIPGARLLPLAGEVHSFALDDPKSILDATNAFLDEDPETRRVSSSTPVAEPQGPLRTVLFTDLVGHTAMMSRLGDEGGREVLREHERITRHVLKAHSGTEVKTMGDGFMAWFGSVTRAVECAIALQRAFAEREGEPLSVRVGLNAGEPIEEEGDLFGATVILASRIAAKADGGEILVADTVRGLCSGKGFLFADSGEFVAKGFEEPVRVYEVRWRDG